MKKIIITLFLFIPLIVNAQTGYTFEQWMFREMPDISNAKPAVSSLRGRILLRVESHGEAWYVRPQDGTRVYLKNGDAAYAVMRDFGLGVSNADLAKIPVGLYDYGTYDADNDNDGLSNKTEEAIGTDMNNSDTDGDSFNDGDEIKNGYDPLGPGKLNFDSSLVSRLKGRILLQVQSQGQAWYMNPVDGKRYFMANGQVAYQMMRYMSLGISDKDLAKIAYYNNSALSYDWKTYQNTKYGYTFRYPSNWDLSDWVADKIRPDFVRVEHPNVSWKFAVCPDPSGTDCAQYVGLGTTYVNKVAKEVNILGHHAMEVDYSFADACKEFGCAVTYTFIDKPDGWGTYNGWENDADIILEWQSSEGELMVKSIFNTFKLTDNSGV